MNALFSKRTTASLFGIVGLIVFAIVGVSVVTAQSDGPSTPDQSSGPAPSAWPLVKAMEQRGGTITESKTVPSPVGDITVGTVEGYEGSEAKYELCLSLLHKAVGASVACRASDTSDLKKPLVIVSFRGNGKFVIAAGLPEGASNVQLRSSNGKATANPSINEKTFGVELDAASIGALTYLDESGGAHSVDLGSSVKSLGEEGP